MKILIFGRDSALPPSAGASGVYTWGMTKGFAGNNHDVTVISKMYFGRVRPYSQKGNIRVIRSPRYPYQLREYGWGIELALGIKMVNPDLVLLRVPEENFIPGLDYIRWAISDITTTVLSKINFVPDRWAPGISSLLMHSDYIICETKGHKNYFKKEIKKKCIVSPNGVDTELFDHKGTQSAVRNENKIVILGSLDKFRKAEEVVEAFYKADIPNKSLRIIGSGPAEEAIKQKIKSYEIEDDVEMLGKVPHGQVPSLIRNCSLGVVLPSEESKEYTHPLKLFEFLSMGTPVLTTKEIDVTKELHDECYISIPDVAIENIVEGLEHCDTVTDNPDICVSQAQKFTWKSVTADLLDKVDI